MLSNGPNMIHCDDFCHMDVIENSFLVLCKNAASSGKLEIQ